MKKLHVLTGISCATLMSYGLVAQAATVTTPLNWTPGKVIVDGDTSDWNLSTDKSTIMCEAGSIADSGTSCDGKDQLSTLYTRYDCNTNTMYVLVLKKDGHTANNNASWVKIYDLGSSEVALNRSPVITGGAVQGYEASFSLAAGKYNNAQVHIQIDGSKTSSTGKSSGSKQHWRSIDVPENCTVPDVVDQAAVEAAAKKAAEEAAAAKAAADAKAAEEAAAAKAAADAKAAEEAAAKAAADKAAADAEAKKQADEAKKQADEAAAAKKAAEEAAAADKAAKEAEAKKQADEAAAAEKAAKEAADKAAKEAADKEAADKAAKEAADAEKAAKEAADKAAKEAADAEKAAKEAADKAANNGKDNPNSDNGAGGKGHDPVTICHNVKHNPVIITIDDDGLGGSFKDNLAGHGLLETDVGPVNPPRVNGDGHDGDFIIRSEADAKLCVAKENNGGGNENGNPQGGNPNKECSDIIASNGGPMKVVTKFDWSGNSYTKTDGTDSIDITGDATGGTWAVNAANQGIVDVDAVIVKGATGTYIYNYDANPLTSGTFSKSVLPLNNGGQVPDISNIKFCSDGVLSEGDVVCLAIAGSAPACLTIPAGTPYTISVDDASYDIIAK